MNEETKPKTGLAIAALVLSMLMCFPLFPLIGLILGIVVLAKSGKNPAVGGKGMATAAVIIGAIGLLLSPGVMAAIAIPSFIKYINRAKVLEAEERVTQLFRSAESLASVEREVPGGRTLPPLPPSAPLTPPTRCCENPGGRCGPQPQLWEHPTWRTLGFAVLEPHYYQYEFVSDGRSFTARAVGDLDCDGVTSLFEQSGTIVADGQVSVGPLVREREFE